MGRRIKPSEVLQPNVVAKVALAGEVIGVFRQIGSDAWGDFELDPEPTPGEETAEVPEGSPIMLEPLGADPALRLRVRKGRRVLRLRWTPTAEDRERLASGQWGLRESEQATLFEKIFGLGPKDDPRDDLLEYFLDVKVEPIATEEGLGYTAMIVKKLRGG